MSGLKISTDKARAELQDRMTKGRALEARVNSSSNLHEEFDQITKDYKRWNEFNTTLLAMIFSDDEVLVQYRNCGGNYAITDEGDFGSLVFEFLETIGEKLNFIQSQIEQLNLHEVVRASGSSDLSITREGAFFKGQTFDAMSLILDIFKLATKTIDIVDGYADETVLKLLTKKNSGVTVRILMLPNAVTPAFGTLGAAFKGQWGHLEIRSSKAFHDRFIVIDGVELFHLGTSINHAGKKGFMFSKVEEPSVIYAFLAELQKEWAAATAVI